MADVIQTMPEAPKTHPPVREMVIDAITTSKKRKGTSLHAIKSFLVAQYQVDIQKMNPFIKKFLVSAVEHGELVQVKGQGASGSFKLPTVAKEKKAAPKKAARMSAVPPKKRSKMETKVAE